MPLTPHEYQAALLAEYQRALAIDRVSEPPPGLDPGVAALARRLAAAPVGAAPDPAFVDALEGRLGLLAAPPPAVSPHRLLGFGMLPPVGRTAMPKDGGRSFRLSSLQLPAATTGSPAKTSADLTGQQFPPTVLPPRTRWSALRAGGAIAAAVILFALVALATALLLRDSRQPPAAATAPPTTTVRSAILTMLVTSQTPTGEQQRTTTIWYAAPGQWRSETTGDVPSGATTIVVNDGKVQWWYAPSTNQVGQANATPLPLLSQFGEGVSSLQAAIERLSLCYTVTPAGTDTIVGRATYVLKLGPLRCPRGMENAEWNGPREVWIDQQTLFVLQTRQYTKADEQHPTYSATVTNIAYDVPIDPERFTFVPPPGAQFDDARRPSPTQFLDELERLAPTIAFPVFAPRNSTGMVLGRLPEWTPTQPMLTIEYVPTTIGPDARQVKITQQRAVSTGLVAPYEHEMVQIGHLQGWYGPARDSMYGTQISFFRDGTFVQIQAWGFSKEELIAFAAALVPIPGGHAPLPDPQP